MKKFALLLAGVVFPPWRWRGCPGPDWAFMTPDCESSSSGCSGGRRRCCGGSGVSPGGRASHCALGQGRRGQAL